MVEGLSSDWIKIVPWDRSSCGAVTEATVLATAGAAAALGAATVVLASTYGFVTVTWVAAGTAVAAALTRDLISALGAEAWTALIDFLSSTYLASSAGLAIDETDFLSSDFY